ncbi:hypothetical protein HII36_23130 [Nonomuraea sp. NN258]|uniref:hypothetical protein n=1 Tax=Nonomuraea antri TaxID=2730852 RepID=UPI001568B757|nr:hypothetical protein [Nonomuraea antri]NRQ34703.1 hypothetical protein [Nonomuraea antri]
MNWQLNIWMHLEPIGKTDNVNQAKGDQDPAMWQPPRTRNGICADAHVASGSASLRK